MQIVVFYTPEGYLGAIRYGWNPLTPNKPLPDNTFEIPQIDLPILEDFILCRKGIKIVKSKDKHDIKFGESLCLKVEGERNISEYNETKKMLNFLSSKNLN